MTYEAANVVSLFLTPTTIYLCFLTALLFYRNAANAFFSQHPKATGWIAMGIVASFSGSLVDNVYWGAAWSADFTHSAYRDWLFQHGVFSNIPFRQSCDSLGAYCHIIAAVSFYRDEQLASSKVSGRVQKEIKQLHRNIGYSFLVGVVFVAVLFAIRWSQ